MRRRYRDAKGVEEGEHWGGCSIVLLPSSVILVNYNYN